MKDFGNCKNSVGLKPIAVRLSKPARSHALRGNAYDMGRSASPVFVSRSPNTEDAERPGCIPTQIVGTRLSAGLLSLTAMAHKHSDFVI